MDDHGWKPERAAPIPPLRTYSEALDTVFAAVEIAAFFDPKVNERGFGGKA